MIRTHSFVFRLGASLALIGTATFALPMAAISAEIRAAGEAQQKREAARATQLATMKPSRDLSGKEMTALRGKSGPNPYLSGSAKWGMNIDGVDITTGNLSISATDLNFEGGYGIPVNVTRSYSANNPDEGPLGVGWTLSVDLRTTAGGLLKSGGAPVRSVPLGMKERPEDQQKFASTGLENEPVSAMLGTDSGGNEETIQRDVDGIMMPPAWDTNVIDTEYETLIIDDGGGDEVYQIAKAQTITTPEGTVYQYTKQGEYVRVDSGPTYSTAGLGDFRDPPAANSNTRTPSNVLKISSVTDRHGNVTTYSYDDGAWVYYEKANGTTKERRLESISMPGGRGLYFNYGEGAASKFLVSVQDYNSGSGRTVSYAFGTGEETPTPEPVGYLKSATSAGGKITKYHYQAVNNYSHGATPILRTVTDPRGLITTFRSCIADVATPIGYCGPSVYTFGVLGPNGSEKRFNILPDGAAEMGQAPTIALDPSSTHRPRFATSSALTAGAVVVFVNSDHWQNYGEDFQMLTVYEWLGPVDTDLDGIDEGPFLEVRGSRLAPTGLSSTGFPWSRKVFSSVSQNLVRETSMGNYSAGYLYGTEKTTYYNFRGQPLREWVEDGFSFDAGALSGSERTMVTDYAYWGRSKYFQQKAVRGPYQWDTTDPEDIRYSFTDYYDSYAADGSKGQTKEVYRSGVDSDFTNTFTYIPGGIGNPDVDNEEERESTNSVANDEENLTVTDWKRTIKPASGAIKAASFSYDSEGRVTSVHKLQKETSGTPTYVETTTLYGSGGSPTWGMPESVTEADGTADERTTTTDEYDRSGRAVVVIDANTRTHRTTYDEDGLVELIENYNAGWGGLVTNEHAANGQLEHTVDWSQGGEQIISYGDDEATNPGDRGQVMSVQTVTLNDDSTISYEYDEYGRRSAMETSGGRRFEYHQYEWFGMPGQEQPVFTHMVEDVLDDSVWVPSSEEYSYSFDMSGRLVTARFAPSATAGSWHTGSRSWYGTVEWGDEGTNAYRPSSYASQSYEYDRGGRLDRLITEWNKWNSLTDLFVVTTIRSAEYAYDGDFRLRSGFELKDNSSTLYSQSYEYDAWLDYLTSVTYTVGMSGTNKSYTYDASGNRTFGEGSSDYTYDSLNRMTESPYDTYDHDEVGNRVSDGTGHVFGWDDFNRMVYSEAGIYPNRTMQAYYYLPGGLRSTVITTKQDDELFAFEASGFYDSEPFENLPTQRFRYDGHMTLEEDVTYDVDSATYCDETRYTPGARGIESIVAERTAGDSGGGVTAHTQYRTFPIYDGHGNMIATIGRHAGDTYDLDNEKVYDVWGSVRSVSATGSGDNKLNPNKGYCASLGHTMDRGTGLIYMQARYYEPSTGRFISEDPEMNDMNHYTYACSNPVEGYDANGRKTLFDYLGVILLAWAIDITCGLLPNGDMVKDIYHIVGSAIATIRMLQETVRLSLTVARTAEATAPLATAGGLTVLAAIATSVAPLARFVAAGCQFAQTLVAYSAIIMMLLEACCAVE